MSCQPVFSLIKLQRCRFLFHFKHSWGAERISGILFFLVQPFTFCIKKYLQSLHLPINALHTRKKLQYFVVVFLNRFFLPSNGLHSILYINEKVNVATRRKWDNLMSWASAASFVAQQQKTTKTDNEAECGTVLPIYCSFQRWTHSWRGRRSVFIPQWGF